MAPVYGVLGYPIKLSLSKVMFEAAFYEYNMDAVFEYFDIHPDDLKHFLIEAKKRPISGFTVRAPHKEAILPLLDGLDKHAKTIGSVNTVMNVNGKLKGYNTEWSGTLRAIEDVIDLNEKRVLVLGAGGTARSVVYGCKSVKAEVTVLNRTIKKAKELADKFSVNAGFLGEIRKHRPHVLINTTSVGMSPNTDQSLVPSDFFLRGMVVMDMVYNPMETRLVREARRKECRIVPGQKLFLYQGQKQFELWFKKQPRLDKMEEALLEAIQ